MLSRSSLKYTTRNPEMLEMVHSVSRHLLMSDERRQEFRTETAKDIVLSEIPKYYYNKWPKEHKISEKYKPYYKLQNDIYIKSGIIFLEHKSIVPETLRQFVINILHKSHLGLSKTINKARKLCF